jgi:hypothetical protein
MVILFLSLGSLNICNMNHWLNEGKQIMKKREKHPYYDSDRKKRTEEFSLKVSAFCIVGMVIILILAKIFQ